MNFKQWCDICRDRVDIKTESEQIEVCICPNCGRPLMPCPVCGGKMDTRELGCKRGCSLRSDYVKKMKEFSN